jgi:DNA-binding NarL/FixJ family response regulator
MTVLLCDERTLRRRCLAQFLELSGLRVRITALEKSGQGETFAAPDEVVDLAIIDTGEKSCNHPGVRRIFDDLRRVLPSVLIVVVSDREDGSAAVEAMQLGARAYFPSSLDPIILVEALRFIQNGGTFVPPSALMNEREPEKLPPSSKAWVMEMLGVTERELAVLELLQRGQSNKAIARELAIEEGTVKAHVHRILKKLRADNRTQAALLARQMANKDPTLDPRLFQ